MYIGFEIPEKNLWWRPDYWPYTNDSIFDIIQNFKNSFLNAKNTQNKSDFDTLVKYYKDHYVYDCLCGEKNLTGQVKKPFFLNNLYNEIKFVNMYNALNYALHFKQSHNCVDENDFFSIENAKHVNKIVGCGLWENPGSFRTGPASSSNFSSKNLFATSIENYEYVDFILIEEKLKTLFIKTHHLLTKHKEISERIKIGTLFFLMFLDIHPFKNGNGRTARILLSFILKDNCCLPVGFLNTKDGREIYLKCLCESRQMSTSYVGTYYYPGALCAFLLESILSNINFLNNLFYF